MKNLRHGVSVWKSIGSGWLAFSKLLRYDVGDDTNIKFWEDVWCEDCSLYIFLELHSISRAREVTMSEVMRLSDGRIHWDIQFCRPMQNLEAECWICVRICFFHGCMGLRC